MFTGLVVFSQEQNIRGTVVDETGEGLPGVTILEVGTTNGVITDADGNFSMTVSSGAKIRFSYVGFATQTVEVGSQTVFDISLQIDAETLNEVVVVGYGTQKKSNLTGSVVSVGGESLKKVPVSTVAESLTGRLAGVQITSAEGSPDSEISIRVRGGSSLTQSSQPLFIVDGFPVPTIADLAPSDIESIDVLKDASSTAIYGSRGANGVVIVTTKSGREGKVTVNYNTFYAVKKIASTLDVLDPFDFVRLQYEWAVLNNEDDLSSYENYFGLYDDIDLYRGAPANDWQRQVFGRTGNTWSNDLSIRGGGSKFNYSVNFARFDDKSILIGSGYERNNITLKFKNRPTDNIELDFSLRYSDTEITGGGANEQNEFSSSDSRLKNAIGFAPIPVPGISQTTDTDESVQGSLVNPITFFNDNDRLQKRKNFNIGGAFSWNILEDLKVSTSFNVDNYSFIDNRFFGVSTSKARDNSALAPNQPSVIFEDDKEVRLRSTNLINYTAYNNREHSLDFLVGQEYLFRQREQLEYEVQGYPVFFTSDEAFKLTTQGIPFEADNFQSPDDKLLSFFSRANYSFRERYFLTASFRADGSSRFIGDNVWGYFPAASAGWDISKESFMSTTSSWMHRLKLRASYGVSGNNNIPVGQTAPIYTPRITARINGEDRYWAVSNTLPNPDLKWETTQTLNVGLDFGLLEGRVMGTMEIYQNNTTNLLLERPLTGANGGYQSRFENSGEIESKGLELSLGLIPIDKEEYGLNVNFNIAFNRNEIIELGGLQELGGDDLTTRWASSRIPQDYVARVGGPIGQIFGYVNDGRYEVDDFEGYINGEWVLKDGVVGNDEIDVAPGVIKLADLDGDGVVTIDDRKIIGNTNPEHTGGVVFNAYAYGFDLTAAFNWSYGNDVYNANKIQFTTARQQYTNLIDMQRDGVRWTNIDWNTGELITDPAQLEAANANTTMWTPFGDTEILSDWAVEDGSFLRLNTLSLGYTVPNKLTSTVGIESLRFYVTGYNVFLLTNYSGFDPEVSTRRKSQLTPGVDFSAYPRSRQLTVGMNLTF